MKGYLDNSVEIQYKKYTEIYRNLLFSRILRLFCLSLLFFLIQYVSKSKNEVFFELKESKVYSRKLMENEEEKIKIFQDNTDCSIVNLWASQRAKWRKGNYEMRKMAHEEWKRECLENNINDSMWINKTWFNWRFKSTEQILKKMGEDHINFLCFLNTFPSYNSIYEYLENMKKSLENYHELILNNWRCYMNDSINDWKEQRKNSLKKDES
ncbi:Plasmodium exported protein, unknown function [Plasmodium gallinaceum]|uniref:Plasmodium RESA N-terminal domain-containing protein n=1 Tax=Plasmodium gallinaceum TaxID=5849 RepID=A0A1J1GP47_PLAGA|nr:Plasmodium exported protein, unknown function [Plasmodium gallinaceum]CRG94068.1 Plasmodium exported protein, unknown function [Plasmodium gallinaceum]